MGRKIILKIKEELKNKGYEQKKLAEMTGLTERTISEMCNNKVERIPKTALAKIADALEIDDINKLIIIEKDAE